MFPSSTNFLLLRSLVPSPVEELRQRGVLVMDVSDQLGPGFIRVNLVTPDENDTTRESGGIAAGSVFRS